jgi:hypothetical protein
MPNIAVEQQEAVERMWFRRVVIVLMVGMISVGAVPIVKNAMFPVQKTNR